MSRVGKNCGGVCRRRHLRRHPKSIRVYILKKKTSLMWLLLSGALEIHVATHGRTAQNQNPNLTDFGVPLVYKEFVFFF